MTFKLLFVETLFYFLFFKIGVLKAHLYVLAKYLKV